MMWLSSCFRGLTAEVISVREYRNVQIEQGLEQISTIVLVSWKIAGGAEAA